MPRGRRTRSPRSERLAGPAASAGVGDPTWSPPCRRTTWWSSRRCRAAPRPAGRTRLDGRDAGPRPGARSSARSPSRRRAGARPLHPDALRPRRTLLARVRPDVADDAQALAERLGERRTVPGSALLHGDVHLKNGLLAGDQVHLVDLDQCARGHPAADIGSLLAALRHRRLIGGLTADRAGRAGGRVPRRLRRACRCGR